MWLVAPQADCTVRLDALDGGPSLGSFFGWSSGQFIADFPGVGTCMSQAVLSGPGQQSRWACPGQCEFLLTGCM